MTSYQAESFEKDDVKTKDYHPPNTTSPKRMEHKEFDESKEEKLTTHITSVIGRTKTLIIPLFGVIALVCILLGILGMTDVWEDPANILIMLAVIIIGAMAGAFGIYKWGTIQMTIKRLGDENKKYESELDLMKINANNLKTHVNGLQSHVNELQRDTEELNTAMREFDDLRKSLSELSRDNEEIDAIITKMDSVYEDMYKVIIDNEKAKLFEMYYDVELRDGSKGLSKGEYNRLLGRLSSDQKERLQKIGSFEEIAGDDGIMSFGEFQSLVQRCLESYEAEIIRKESSSMLKSLGTPSNSSSRLVN